MRLAAALVAAASLGAARAGAAGVRVGPPLWVVPERVPAEVARQASNNNVAVALFRGRLYMAYRSGPHHFASKEAALHVLSSADEGASWRHERTLRLGRDVREPSLVPWKGRLLLYYVVLGASATAYEPGAVWKTELGEGGVWSEPREGARPGDVVWEVKARRGRLWRSVWSGARYGLRVPRVELRFESSEDGDATGFGSHLVSAPAGEPGAWAFPAASSPLRYDSPRLFEQGGELYLLARRDPTGPYERGWTRLPMPLRRLAYMIRYWLTPKRTALYRLDRAKREVVHLADLPSAGDTAFPAVVRLGPRTWLAANYTSPLDAPGASWLRGQTSRRGTGIYLVRLEFGAGAAPPAAP